MFEWKSSYNWKYGFRGGGSKLKVQDIDSFPLNVYDECIIYMYILAKYKLLTKSRDLKA